MVRCGYFVVNSQIPFEKASKIAGLRYLVDDIILPPKLGKVRIIMLSFYNQYMAGTMMVCSALVPFL